MALRVGINGFGRIGRNVLRALLEQGRTDIEVVAINDLGPIATNAHLLKYDSVHGRLNTDVQNNDEGILINGQLIRVSAERDPAALAWQDVDIAMECTGVFTSKAKAETHLKNGSNKVLVSAPSQGADKTIVYGVNHGTLSNADLIVSNASCTTNCLAPVAKVLHDTFGIRRGLMTTVHSYTGDQPTLDTMHSDLYRGRAAAMNMIPTSTGAARAVGLVLPELAGKLDGTAIRVPTPNVSCVDLTVELNKDTTEDEVNAALTLAAQGQLNGVLGVTSEPLVSMDFNHNPLSSCIALDQTKLIEGNMLRVLSWYDNEWGFSNRMLDTAVAMSQA